MRNPYNNNESKSSGGIGFVGLLQILFIGLKLCEVIDWSWWWVWSPALASTAVVIITVAVLVVYYLRKK